MKKLGMKSLCIRVFSDASLAFNKDLSYQLEFIIILSDEANIANIFHLNSYKHEKASRSILGTEVYTFADAFDHAYTLKYDSQIMLRKHMSLYMLTDSKSLFDTLTKSSTTNRKPLMIDVRTVRDGYAIHKIFNVRFIRSENSLV